MKSLIKKYILTCVSFAMLISMVHAQPMHVHAEDVKSKTDAEMIVNNYDLSNKEESILLHNTINSTQYEYIEPTDEMSSTLIEVDPDNFTISAKPYSDTYNNQWIPEKAIIIENNSETEYSLNNGNATFIANTDNYSVQVVYNTYKSLNTETQYRLLNTPYWLYNGFDAVNHLYSISSEFEALANHYLPHLIKMRDGVDTPYGISITGDYAIAVTNLENQMKKNKNSTGYFDLNEEVAIYGPYRLMKRQEYYFSKNALNLRDVTEKMKVDLENIARADGIKTVIEFGSSMSGYESMVNAMKSLVNYLESLIHELEICLEQDDWEGRNHQLLNKVQGNTGITSKVNASGMVYLHAKEDIQENLLFASKTLQCVINRDRVNVTVEAYVVEETNSTELVKIQSEPIEIALKHEMSAIDVDNAIKERIESTILDGWFEEYQIGEEFYIRTHSNIGEKLMNDSDYVITYMPKNYNITYSDNGDESLNVPYGYLLELPKAGNGMSYEYTIKDEAFREGDIYRITDNTSIERIIGKEKVVDRLLNVLSRDNTYTISELAKSILMNEAIISDTVEYRIVEEMDVNADITYNEATKEYSLVVNSYPSGIDGMDWNPVSFTIVKGDTESNTRYTIQDGKATFKTDYFDSLNIAYELVVNKTEKIRPILVTNNYLLEQINIPASILEDSKAQIESLDYLASFARNGGYLTMGGAIYSALTILKSNYEEKYGKDSSSYPEVILKEYNALLELRDECFNPDNKDLYVYEYILKYMPKSMNAKASGLGLIAYYHDEYGYEQYKKQLDLLTNNLDIARKSEEFNLLLTGELEPYKEKVEKLIEVLESIDLIAPSKYINLESPAVSKLFDILDDKKTEKQYDSVSVLTDRVVINKPQEGKVSVTLNLNIDGVKQGSNAVVFDVNTVLTQNDINKIQNTLNELYENFDQKYYSKEQALNLPQVGTKLIENIHLTESWKAKNFSVYVLDSNTNKKEKLQNISINNTLITLPKPQTGYRYDYEVLGNSISVETSDVSYNLTSKQFESIVNESELVISRNTVDLTKERLTQLFNDFNESFSNLKSEFILAKDNESYVAILRVDPSEGDAIQKQLVNIVIDAMESRYSYVAMGNRNQALWDANAAKLSLQPYVDSMLQSNFDMNVISELFDTEGNIKENVFDYISKNPEIIVGSKDDLSNLGGYLYDTTLYLGRTKEDSSFIEVKYIVSIEDFDKQASNLIEVKENIEKSMNYHSFDTDNDRLNLSNTLDDELYQFILSQMISSGYMDDTKVNDATFDEIMKYFEQYSELFMNQNVTSNTIQNTLNSLDVKIDLTDSKDVIDLILDLNREYSFEKEEDIQNGIRGKLNFDLNRILQELNVSEEVKPLFNQKLSIPTTISCSNLDKSYEALVYDAEHENGHKMVFVESLNSFDTKNDELIIVLLKDINHDLKLKVNTFLDLNGFKVSGNVNSNSKCIILDSTYTNGSVTGKLNGNIQVMGGTYSILNINDYLVDGYEMKDGKVTPKFVTIKNYDEEFIIELDPQLFYMSGELTNTITRFMLVLNDFSKASVKVGDYVLYEPSYKTLKEFIGFNLDDAANDLLDEINVNQASQLFNDLIRKLTNYKELLNKEITTYSYETKPYLVEYIYNNVKDVFEGNLKVSNTSTNKELKIQLKEDKAYTNVLNVLKDVASFGYEEIQIKDFDYDSNLEIDTNNIEATLTINNSVKYTILYGVILAYGTNDIDLIQSVKDYILNEKSRNESTENLLSAIHDLTTKEIVDAIHKVSSLDVTFSNMSDTLQLPEYEHASDLDLVSIDFIDYLSTKLNAYGKTGNSEELKSAYTYRNFYEFDELNVEINLVAELPCLHRKVSKHVISVVTCTQDGKYQMICDDCNEVLEEVVTKSKGHGHTQIMNRVTETCTKPGYTGDLVCDDCHGIVEEGKVIPATNHPETYIQNAKQPTCLSEGYTGDFYCSICKAHVSKGMIIPKTDHEYANGNCIHCQINDPYYSPYPLGDVSGDYKVNSLDYVKIKNHIMGVKHFTSEELNRADVSKDGKITSLDYIKIKKHIMGIDRLF